MNAADCRAHAAAMVDLIHGLRRPPATDTELRRRPAHLRALPALEVEAILLGSWAVERRGRSPATSSRRRPLAEGARPGPASAGRHVAGPRPRARDRHGCRLDCGALVGPAGGDHRVRTRERTRRVAVGSAGRPLLRAGGHVRWCCTPDRTAAGGTEQSARRITPSWSAPSSRLTGQPAVRFRCTSVPFRPAPTAIACQSSPAESSESRNLPRNRNPGLMLTGPIDPYNAATSPPRDRGTCRCAMSGRSGMSPVQQSWPGYEQESRV